MGNARNVSFQSQYSRKINIKVILVLSSQWMHVSLSHISYINDMKGLKENNEVNYLYKIYGIESSSSVEEP